MAFSDDPEHTKSATGFDRAEEIEHVAETSDMPKGYFRSPLFLGSYTAAGLGLLAAIAGFSFIAPVLSIINEDVGPSTNISWIAILYTLAIAVGLTVAGRLGDLFGRRYVFITGAVLGVIGSIVSALANSVTVLIVGMLFIGLAASTQVSYFYVIAELTPNKYRFIGNAVGYIFAIPGGAFAPALAHSAILHTSAGWRTLYWILLGLNVAALVCWVVFYRPPTFAMKHMHARRRDYVRHFDYVGCVLFVGGLVLFLLGLQWGGSAYPWNSAHVIATLTVGLVSLLAFVLWECFANLAEPLVPMQLLRAPGFLAAVVVSGLGASLYYALGVVWPSMVTNVYASGDFMTDGWVASITGVGWVFGEILSGFLAKPLGRIKEQCIVTLLIAGVFLGSMATCQPSTKTTACVLLSFAVFFAGYVEGLALTITTLVVPNQDEIGAGCGFGGSIRFTITSIATTIYSVVLSARSSHLVPRAVSAATLQAGLPETSVDNFVIAFSSGQATSQIPGVSSSVIAAATAASAQAYADSYRTVFFTTIAFCGLGVLTTFCLPNVDMLMSDDVAVTLRHGEKEAKSADGED